MSMTAEDQRRIFVVPEIRTMKVPPERRRLALPPDLRRIVIDQLSRISLRYG
jgi:hypothetical protein